jgi:hypothetical protein
MFSKTKSGSKLPYNKCNSSHFEKGSLNHQGNHKYEISNNKPYD